MNAPVEGGLLSRLSPPPEAPARFLLPGEWWLGTDATRVSTLLGSCVAVALWHPRRGIGGMCHYLVPGRVREPGRPLDGRYADEAIELLVQAILRAGSLPNEYRVHLVGGAHMFPQLPSVTLDIGARNAEEGLKLLQQRQFAVPSTDVGGTLHRRIELDLATGRVHVRAGA